MVSSINRIMCLVGCGYLLKRSIKDITLLAIWVFQNLSCIYIVDILLLLIFAFSLRVSLQTYINAVDCCVLLHM